MTSNKLFRVRAKHDSSTLLGLGGTVVGAYFGGPMGAMAGGAAGRAAGGAMERR